MEQKIKYADICSQLRSMDVSEENIERLKAKGLDALERALIMIKEIYTYYVKMEEKELDLI